MNENLLELSKLKEEREIIVKSNDYFKKGWALKELGNYNQAISCFHKAIQINPNEPEYYYEKGWAFRELGNYNQAISCFDKAIEINPNEPKYYCNKGGVFFIEKI